MSPFKKFILIVVLAILMLITVYTYFIFLNTGVLEIKTGQSDYSAHLAGTAYPCFAEPCLIKLKSGSYQITIDKPGFYPFTGEVVIKRGGKTSLEPLLEEIPSLRVSTFTRETDSQPALPITPEGTLGGTWNKAENRYLFLNEEDEKLMIRDEKATEVISTLKNLTPPLSFYWSPDENHAIIADRNELFFIKTGMGSRNKLVADFEPTEVLWTTEVALLNDKTNAVYVVNLKNFNEIIKTKLKLTLSASVPTDGNHLLTYQQSGNTTKIILIDLINQSQNILTERLDFPVDDIYYDSALSMAYFRESNSQNWYEIKIRQ